MLDLMQLSISDPASAPLPFATSYEVKDAAPAKPAPQPEPPTATPQSNASGSGSGSGSASAAATQSNISPKPATEYVLKSIEWKDPRHAPTDPPRQLKIIAQNENGPCPLLALCNVLLLRGDIEIGTERSTVSYEYLVDLIGDVLLTRTNTHHVRLAN
jgi:hypothetical protein